MIVVITSTAPYVEVNEKAKECSFRSLEFVNATFVGEGQKILLPRLSKTTRSSLGQVIGKRVRAGIGSRQKLQGRVRPIAAKQKNDHFGLGYTPTGAKKRKFLEEKKERRLASFSGREVKDELMKIPLIDHTFRSVGFIHPDQAREKEKEKINMTVEAFEELMVGAIGEDGSKDERYELPPFSRGQELNNWHAIELPVVFKFPTE